MRKEIQRAESLLRAERYREVVDLAQSLLVEDPQDLEALATIGIAFTEMGEHDEGYSMLKRSFALNREDYRTLYGLAYAETTVHRYEAAAARLHDLLEKDLPESFKKLAEMSLERLSAVL